MNECTRGDPGDHPRPNPADNVFDSFDPRLDAIDGR
jgi:hypothetical protein